MAHAIDQSNDRANIAYVGEVPWHGLGQQLTPAAPLKVWTKEAGMDWHVKTAPVIFKDGDKELAFPDRNALYRSDTKAGLGIVSDAYKIVQPKEVMEFFRDLIDGQGFQMETAGCLFGGSKFWALAKTGDSIKLAGVDEVKPYLLMATSCDGSMATAVHFTSVRVVCNNTLRMSIGDGAKLATIKVPHSANFDAAAVKAQLGIAGDAWENFIGSMQALANFQIDRDTAIQVIADQLKTEWKTQEGDDMAPQDMLESSRLLRRIITLYDGAGIGADMSTTKGTAWGLVNAVTQYFDHEAGSTADKSRAFERAHLTDRARFKTRVADALLDMAA